MQLSKNAVKVLERRYLAKDQDGKIIETIDDMFTRVAKTIAKVDKLYDKSADVKKIQQEFYEMMTNLEFLPNSPTLMNAGRKLGQLSACFVLPIEDSMEGIFDAVKNAALIHKSGGGTGFSFSRLRPKGSSVRSTGGVASGPVSFMKVFNSATEAVKQGGTRRGANMGILRVDHPDIIEFIQCKKDNDDITNFNISIGITEEFMDAVEKDEEYRLINPHDKSVAKTLKARDVFDLIVEMAWNNGEPGIIFLDRLNKDNVVPQVGEIESTNPCGEQPLLPYESCNLGSINLSKFVQRMDDDTYQVDYKRLEKVVNNSVHFLDNVIDANKYPLKEIEEMTKSTRKIGLGVMGFADLLFMLNIPYDSQQAVELAEQIMKFISEKSREASHRLAQQRGAFPLFEKSALAKSGKAIRNATTTTIAPTGTISIIAGASSGVEPLFAISFIRNVMDNDELLEVHPFFKETAIKRGFYSDQLMREIADRGSLKDIDGIPEDIKRLFVTSHDITPEYHIKMQAAFQKYTDNAVSKTVNFRKSADREDVKKVYLLAYKLGCKGVTIYRDGSRDSQVLNIGNKDVNIKDKIESSLAEKGVYSPSEIVPRPRPEVTAGITEKVRIGCGNLYITVNYDDRGICEVFTNLGRGGGCPSQSEATSRLVSIALRAGVDVETLIEQLKGIRCATTIRQKGLKVLSCPDAIGRVIEKVVKLKVDEHFEATDVEAINGFSRRQDKKSKMRKTNKCPECNGELEHEGGCVVCRSCGYSKCG